jgi:hypothetical protein
MTGFYSDIAREKKILFGLAVFHLFGPSNIGRGWIVYLEALAIGFTRQ